METSSGHRVDVCSGDLFTVRLNVSGIDVSSSYKTCLLTVVCIECIPASCVYDFVSGDRYWPGGFGGTNYSEPMWLCVCAELGLVVISQSLLVDDEYGKLVIPFSSCE